MQIITPPVVDRENQDPERDRRLRVREERAGEERMASRANEELRSRVEMEKEIGTSGQEVETFLLTGHKMVPPHPDRQKLV